MYIKGIVFLWILKFNKFLLNVLVWLFVHWFHLYIVTQIPKSSTTHIFEFTKPLFIVAVLVVKLQKSVYHRYTFQNPLPHADLNLLGKFW